VFRNKFRRKLPKMCLCSNLRKHPTDSRWTPALKQELNHSDKEDGMFWVQFPITSCTEEHATYDLTYSMISPVIAGLQMSIEDFARNFTGQPHYIQELLPFIFTACQILTRVHTTFNVLQRSPSAIWCRTLSRFSDARASGQVCGDSGLAEISPFAPSYQS